ncbi:MAG: hypothetical protein ACOX8I_10640 [Bacillota bacterium]
MLFIIENYDVKVGRNRKDGSKVEKENRNFNNGHNVEVFGMTNFEAQRSFSVGRIF